MCGSPNPNEGLVLDAYVLDVPAPYASADQHVKLHSWAKAAVPASSSSRKMRRILLDA